MANSYPLVTTLLDPDRARPSDLSYVVPELWQFIMRNGKWSLGHTVYIIQEGENGPSKVGNAGDPFHRLKNLQCGNPRPLTVRHIYSGAKYHCLGAERWVHRHFTPVRTREWIHAQPEEIVAFMLTIRMAHGIGRIQ